MPSANRETLTTRFVEALPISDREIVVWDRELPGFGVRVHPSGSKVYMVHKRSGGKSRRVTIGSHGIWSLDAARREAGGNHCEPEERRYASATWCGERLWQRSDNRRTSGTVHG